MRPNPALLIAVVAVTAAAASIVVSAPAAAQELPDKGETALAVVSPNRSLLGGSARRGIPELAPALPPVPTAARSGDVTVPAKRAIPDRQEPDEAAEGQRVSSSVPEPEVAPSEPELPMFARADGVGLTLISPEVRTIGFHQAGRSARTVAMVFKAPSLDAKALVMPSRGRGTNRRSAVDIAVPAGEPILSPVTGKVVRVQRYALYGRVKDMRVHIVPDVRPDREVVMLHVGTVRVGVGDRVLAGETAIAGTARILPFRSQVERFSGTMPHIHLEVRRR